MDNNLKNRVITEANIFLDNKTTVRGVSKKIGISKSTVHKDFIERLKEIDLFLYNKDIRHLRGGQATKEYYENKKR